MYLYIYISSWNALKFFFNTSQLVFDNSKSKQLVINNEVDNIKGSTGLYLLLPLAHFLPS